MKGGFVSHSHFNSLKCIVFVLGNVIFSESPTPEYLNSEPFEHMRLTTWMDGDRIVNFTSDVQFENVIFEKSITTAV